MDTLAPKFYTNYSIISFNHCILTLRSLSYNQASRLLPTEKKLQANPREEIFYPDFDLPNFASLLHWWLYGSGMHIGFLLVSHRLRSDRDRDSTKCARNSSLASLKYPAVYCQAGILLVRDFHK